MERRLEALEVDKAREHNEKMKRAGEEFGQLLDRDPDEQRAAMREALFGALRRRHGLDNDQDEGEGV